MTNVIRSSFVILGALALVGGATYAYFSDTETTAASTITAGTLDIDILNQNSPNALSFALVDMFPGDEQTVGFDVKNNSTETINLRGFASGSWNFSPSDPNLIQVTKVEYWDGAGWDEIDSEAEGIDGLFYYSLNGTNDDLFDVAPNGLAQFRLTVKLDEAAGNPYQGKVFSATLTVEGKQSISGTTWPE